MKNILLAWPGTWKTTNIKKIIESNGGGSGFLILSFTNATVDDLRGSLGMSGVTTRNCMTLHSCALRMNNDRKRHVLLPLEIKKMKYIHEALDITFEQLCDFLSCTTYDQMIDRFVDFARANPVILREKLSTYHSVIIDEFQDFNEHEQKLLDLIMDNVETSYILWDDDQCIYDFKQASADKIIALHKDTTNNTTIPHKHICYRCPDQVIEHGTNLIKNNRNRIDKKWSNQSEEGWSNDGIIQHHQLLTGEQVAQFIVDKILSLGDDPDVLILAPVDFTAKPVANKLTEIGIEFENHFDEKLPEEVIKLCWEVKCLYGKFTYFNLVILWYFLMNWWRSNYYKILKKHFEYWENYLELFNLLKSRLPPEMLEALIDMNTFLGKPRYNILFNLFPYSEGDSDEEKLENLLRQSEPREEHNVKLMTIHKSKWLGADYVFIVWASDGIIPNSKRWNISLEWQRRLFYVWITRTKKELYILSNVIFDGADINRVDSTKFKFRGSKKRTWFTSPFVTELKL